MSALLPAAFSLPRRQPAPIAAEPLLDQREADRLRVAGEWVDSMADWAESDLAQWCDRRPTQPDPNAASLKRELRAAAAYGAGALVLVAATVGLLVCPAAKAQEAQAAPDVWVNLGGVSWHDRGHYNGSNPGAGLELRTSDTWGYAAGFYRNSDRHISRYAFVDVTPLNVGPVYLGGIAGLVNGYSAHRGHALPMVLPTAELRLSRVAVQAAFVPHTEHYKNANTVALTLKVRW